MKFKPNLIYHIYNQGNNRQQIFFQPRNYDYFLGKMERHFKPHGDFLCYCLMPNHFHWLFRTHAFDTEGEIPLALRDTLEPLELMPRSLSTLLSSYTRGVNNQEGRTGSLFRGHTKSKKGQVQTFLDEDGEAFKLVYQADLNYAKTCFRYIHNNPVKARLCLKPEEWPHSSAKQYHFNDANGFCNLKLWRTLLSTDSI